ncbi:MAG: cytochrome c [Gammaproteobacteria bacterium]|nr:cytochrome c [Gammaproteobacteria bacterium]
MKHKLLLPVSAMLLLSAGPSMAFDGAAGKELADENCYSCHGNDVYTRDNRMVKSRPNLSKQVRRCELTLGLKWFDEDVEDVAGYLNQQFYKFK